MSLVTLRGPSGNTVLPLSVVTSNGNLVNLILEYNQLEGAASVIKAGGAYYVPLWASQIQKMVPLDDTLYLADKVAKPEFETIDDILRFIRKSRRFCKNKAVLNKAAASFVAFARDNKLNTYVDVLKMKEALVNGKSIDVYLEMIPTELSHGLFETLADAFLELL